MLSITNTMPEAYAKIKGNGKYPNLKGNVSFYGVHGGTIVVAEVTGLPENNTFHGFHIHEGENCTGTEAEPFQNAGTHYNPQNYTTSESCRRLAAVIGKSRNCIWGILY